MSAGVLGMWAGGALAALFFATLWMIFARLALRLVKWTPGTSTYVICAVCAWTPTILTQQVTDSGVEYNLGAVAAALVITAGCLLVIRKLPAT